MEFVISSRVIAREMSLTKDYWSGMLQLLSSMWSGKVSWYLLGEEGSISSGLNSI